MTTTEIFSTVVVRPTSVGAVGAYLYAHTEIVARADSPRGDLAALILRTATSEYEGAEGARRAEYLATYQCERLWSGLYPARVIGTREGAEENARHAVGAAHVHAA